MIKNIIFDLSEVYLRGLFGTHELIMEKAGKYLASEDLWFMPATEQLFHGQITEDEYWRIVAHEHRLSLGPEELKSMVRSNFREIEGTRPLIERLKANGYKLGLLSVHTKEWIEYCEEKFDYRRLFDAVVYSYEIAVSKPDPRAYQAILKKLKALPEETVFTDDSFGNVNAAEKLGIKGIVFRNAGQLERDLKGLGVKV